MTPKFFVGALIGALVSCCVVVGHARAATISSTIHGFTQDSAPQNTFGDGLNGEVVEVFNGLTGNQNRGIIEFNISGLMSAMSSATLTLPITTNSLSTTRNFSVFGYTGDGALSFGDYQTSASSIGNFNVTTNQTGSVNVDVTSFINAQIALNDAEHFAGFKIVWNSASSSTEFIIFGNIISDVGTYPTLDVVNTVPLPGTLPLFATALGALGLLGWRRNGKALRQLI